MKWMGRLEGRDIFAEGSWVRAWEEHPYEMASRFLAELYRQEAVAKAKYSITEKW